MTPKRLISVSAALVSVILTVSCTRSAGVDSQRVADLLDSLGIPSMQLSIYQNSAKSPAILFNADSDAVFQAASLSKPVFSYIVMKLVDEGKMDLDTPVASYTGIDRFDDREMASRITPRMVLSHTSGLYNWAASPTSDEWADSRISFHFAPDGCFCYSGEAYAFLQRAAEDVTGKSLDELAREYVFEPFGMRLSSYQWRDAYDSLAVYGFNAEGQNMGRWSGISPNSAYTLRTTSSEYLDFLTHAVLNGEGLSPATYKEWLTPRTHAIRFSGRERACDRDMYWCLGMGVRVSYDADGNPVPVQYWHWGDNDYWKSIYVVDIRKGIAMDYFINSINGHEICDEICRMTLGESCGIQDWIGYDDDM